MQTILVVEDHEKIRANLMLQLKDEGYRPLGFKSAEDARDYLDGKGEAAMMLLDIRLGGMSGVALISDLAERSRLPPTIVVSGEATISETVEALRLGVYDFIEKPVSRHRLLRSVTNCLEHQVMKNKIAELRAHLAEPMLGESEPLCRLKQQIAKVAPTEGRILIRGQSGTGKELVAAAIHAGSRRRGRPFVKVNCAAIPANLIEDELFGHVRGAFTDARLDKAGLFEEAHGGTLFLDEIGDMDYPLQARLLRVLEDGVVRRIGESRDRRVDVRVVCATNCDMEQLIAENKFREDLYFRVAGIPLEVPPLCQRAEDIPLLVTWFVARYCERNQFRSKQIDAGVFEVLKRYQWPGNVRELKNLCERLVILGGDPISEDDLPSSVFITESSVEMGMVPTLAMKGNLSLRDFKANCEKEYIEQTLQRTGWSFTAAARVLGLQRTYLYQKAAALKITKR